MASPLLPYANSRLLIESQGGITVNNGRIERGEESYFLVKAFLKRMQENGTDTGGKKYPTSAKVGRTLPGAAGETFTYRGYALEYAAVPNDYDLRTGDDTRLAYQAITGQLQWMLPGRNGSLAFGDDPILYVTIERSSGLFGGQGIDDIIYREMGGVMLVLTGGEVEN